ncbi:MAG: tetratricopeptide repeat protein, partial [Isosphaeraceae bacterium]
MSIETSPSLETPGQGAAAPVKFSCAERPTVNRWRLPWVKVLAAALFAGLIGFNLWWFWRNTRPVADLKTVNGWLRRQQYDQAEPALREHLRRSPNDGEARMMLAQVRAGRGDLLGCARQLYGAPFWWPGRAEALYRAGQAFRSLDRAKDAEAAWRAVIEDDPLHPVNLDIFHDACLELLRLYATEDRWDDHHVVLWAAYEKASPVDYPTLLS